MCAFGSAFNYVCLISFVFWRFVLGVGGDSKKNTVGGVSFGYGGVSFVRVSKVHEILASPITVEKGCAGLDFCGRPLAAAHKQQARQTLFSTVVGLASTRARYKGDAAIYIRRPVEGAQSVRPL